MTKVLKQLKGSLVMFGIMIGFLVWNTNGAFIGGIVGFVLDRII